MKITQIRENGDTEALSVTDIYLLIEKMKKETKLRPVTGLRQALHFVLPDEPCSLASKLPRVIPAAAFGLSLIHISEPTRLGMISYAVFCLKKKKKKENKTDRL